MGGRRTPNQSLLCDSTGQVPETRLPLTQENLTGRGIRQGSPRRADVEDSPSVDLSGPGSLVLPLTGRHEARDWAGTGRIRRSVGTTRRVWTRKDVPGRLPGDPRELCNVGGWGASRVSPILHRWTNDLRPTNQDSKDNNQES